MGLPQASGLSSVGIRSPSLGRAAVRVPGFCQRLEKIENPYPKTRTGPGRNRDSRRRTQTGRSDVRFALQRRQDADGIDIFWPRRTCFCPWCQSL